MNSHFEHLIPLFKKLTIALLLFSLCRVIFFALNSYHFNLVTVDLFFYGIRFDLVAISFLFSPLIIVQLLPVPFRAFSWYQKLLTIIFYTTNTVAIAVNLIDVAYFDFTLKRTTADFFSMIGTGNDFFHLLPHYIIDFWYNYLIFAMLLLFSLYLYRKIGKGHMTYHPYGLKDYIYQVLIFIGVMGLVVIGMRGGLQYKPISLVSAGQYAPAQNTPIVLNTPFAIIKTAFRDNLEPKTYFSETELNAIYTPLKIIENDGRLKGKNVVIIILESFAKEYVGGFNHGIGYTPFIDSLMRESYIFTNAYSNGQRSIEALPCILGNYPQLMSTPFTLSIYAGNKLNSLPESLKNQGYNTSFYHGGENGTMRFDGFTGAIGINNYFGLNEYPNKENDFDGLWGIFDEPYLLYYASELDQKKEPFFSTIFTVSSHHPYTIPEQHKDKFPKGDLPLHETVGYTDYALSQFFEKAKSMDWFNNTIFIFTADHSAHSNETKHKTKLGRFAVPFFIYAPTTDFKGENRNYFQHIDITPSVLSLLGIKNSIVSFGNNAFAPGEKFFISYIDDSYQIAYRDNFLIYEGDKTTRFYNIIQDPLLNDNLLDHTLTKTQIEQLAHTERFLKAIIQQHDNRLINNQLHHSN